MIGPDPLRRAPVRRDETRLVCTYSRSDETYSYHLTTMPLGTYSQGESDGFPYIVADPTLWQPVIDEIDAQFEARYQAEMAEWAKKIASPAAQQNGVVMLALQEMRPRRVHITPPQFPLASADVLNCAHCGTRFLGQLPIQFLLGQRLRHWPPSLCSNKCETERRQELQRQWRKSHPLHLQEYRDKRSAERAKARSKRRCATCGTAIEAARSTRRFCSDRCRVRAYRTR